MGYLFFFYFSLFFFSHAFLAWILHAFFSMNIFFFLHSPYFPWQGRIFLERVMTCEWSFFIWWTGVMFLRNSQCKSRYIISRCTWILIMGAWRESLKGHNNLTKLNIITSSICFKVLQSIISYGFGRISHHCGGVVL